MTDYPARKLALALAAPLLIGLSACSSGGHKAAPASSAASQPAANAATQQSAAGGATVQVSVPSNGQSDGDLQTKLQQAAVTQSDLPAGWTATTAGDVAPQTGNVSAVYSALFSKGGAAGAPAAGASSLVLTLAAYPDAKTAAANLTTPAGSYSAQSAFGKASFKTSGVKLGDQAVTAQVSSPAGDLAEIIWRRGNVVSIVMLTLPGGSGTAAMDQATATAKAQDAKLAAAGL